jgi:DHA2 family multidrug resistance protein
MLSVMLPTVMHALDTTITIVALPQMQGEMAARQDQIAWVLTSYLVATAVMTPPTGFLASRFGRKRLFLLSVAGFTVASMACGASESLAQLVLFRLLQGGFGAALVPLSQAVLLENHPPHRHGFAMTVWGIGVMIGPILGPTLGGYLTELYSWRLVFYINVPFGLLSFLGILASVSESRLAPRRFDLFGFLLITFAIGALQLMLDRGELLDWFASREIAADATVAAVCAIMYLAHAATAQRPFLDPALFRDRNYLVSLLLMFVLGVVLLATLALLPPLLQDLAGFPVSLTGLVLAPRGVAVVAAMMLAQRLGRRLDPRLLIGTGLALAALSLHEMSLFSLDLSPRDIVRTGIIQGLGLGFLFVPIAKIAFATLSPPLRTDGAAIFNLVRGLGSSIGISLVVSFLARNAQRHYDALASELTPFNEGLRSAPLPLWSLDTKEGLARLHEEVERQATMLAYLDDFRLLMLLAVAALPALLLIRRAGPAVA